MVLRTILRTIDWVEHHVQDRAEAVFLAVHGFCAAVGVALGDADHVAMPITPQLMVGLGNPSQVVSLDPDAVRWYDELQWQASQRWIVCRPGGLEEGRMQIQEVVDHASLPQHRGAPGATAATTAALSTATQDVSG
jgi:hypothetical protein